ncbi:MAG: 4Fe-4S binding protein [Planctomycetota bacterium]|jgi:2-oxoglutarate ferredoxin oxidoreductase subunit delta
MAVTAVRKYRLSIDREGCKGCRLCVEFCPKDVLAMSADRLNSQGVPFAECLHPEQCVGCQACTTVCPDAAIELFGREE